MGSPGISVLPFLLLCLPAGSQAQRNDLFVEAHGLPMVVSPPMLPWSPVLPPSRNAAPDSGLIFLMTDFYFLDRI